MQIKARVDLAEGVDKVRAAGKSRWRGGDQSGVIDGRGRRQQRRRALQGGVVGGRPL